MIDEKVKRQVTDPPVFTSQPSHQVLRNKQLIPAQRWIQHGLLLQQQGAWQEARECFIQALQLQPLCFDAHFHLGNSWMNGGRFAEAYDCYRKALKIRRTSLEALANLGSAALKLGRWPEARDHFTHALRLAPGEPLLRINLGTVMHHLGHMDAALEIYQQCVATTPEIPDAWLNLGHVLHELDRFTEAESAYQEALKRKADYPEALTGLGIVAHKRGEFAMALQWFAAALKHNPQLAQAHYNKSLTLLVTGAYAEGWREYEWRWQTERFAPHSFTQAPWDGTAIHDKTILLHTEQGFGDAIQMIRYVSMARERMGKVVVFCPPDLERLFQTIPQVDHVASRTDLLPPCDCQAPLMSLPGLLGTTLDCIPNQVPYLFVRSDALCATRLETLPGIKVGLVWRGNPQHANDHNRSIDAGIMAHLCRIEGVSFINLQKDIRADEKIILTQKGNFYDFMEGVTDFADTAALLNQLDLVIGVDTSVVHLAGALAKPGWVMLPESNDWRWLRDREDSPWYPTLRLIRRQKGEEWSEVLARVGVLLREGMKK
ncbi:MAG: glycosyltransferase family protein [Magnetococcales bacterium]|nr:glycosyltransferase family protein [Magnetococcales bacterium]